MRQLTILIILLGFFVTAGELQAQTKKKKTAYKTQIAEWKEARNGAYLSVKWTMEVGIIFQEYATAHLYSKENQNSSYWIRLYNYSTPIHQYNIIIVTGQTMGVSHDGSVEIAVERIVNKGVE